MTNLVQMTDHAQARMRQRGYRPDDIDFVVKYGTETRDGIVLTAKDVLREIERRKREIRRLERLKNTYVPLENGKVLTAYRPRRRRMKAILRSAR